MDFSAELKIATALVKSAPLVKSGYWQGISSANRPELATRELLNYTIRVESTDITRIELIEQINPSVPWAEDHFAERISRNPLNPPPSEERWPFAPKGNGQFKKGGVFSHTYPERYWPKNAGLYPYFSAESTRLGIRFPYGDLDDLISMLVADPYTRQAYLPVWFPEDLGAPITERKPCTLGYQLIMRENKLHIVYLIRSCDMYRHLRNDIYMTVLLQHWILDELRAKNAFWYTVTPGSFTMHITSLHLFVNDFGVIE